MSNIRFVRTITGRSPAYERFTEGHTFDTEDDDNSLTAVQAELYVELGYAVVTQAEQAEQAEDQGDSNVLHQTAPRKRATPQRRKAAGK